MRTNHTLVPVIALASVCGVAAAQVVQWPVPQGGDGRFYELVHASVTPAQARDGAAMREHNGIRGQLACITSADENAYLVQAFGAVALQGAIIGGTRRDVVANPADGWHWQSGDAFGYTNWQSGQPDDNGGSGPTETAMEFGVAGGWNDIFPTVTRGAYLVEYAGPAPVAAYPFEGSYNDAASDLYHGLPQGGVSSFDFGVDGLAARFDGVDDWLRVNHGGDLTFDLDTDSFSFSVWVKAETPLSGYQPVVLQDRMSEASTYNVVVREDHPKGNISFHGWYGPGSSDDIEVFADAPVHLRGWVHVVGTYDATIGLQMLFVDGRLVDLDPRPNLAFAPNADGTLSVGAGWYPNAVTNFYRGLIDELRMYDVALSPQEVAALYRPKCPGDLTGSSDPNEPSYGVPNGIVDADDFFYYLDLFTLGCP